MVKPYLHPQRVKPDLRNTVYLCTCYHSAPQNYYTFIVDFQGAPTTPLTSVAVTRCVARVLERNSLPGAISALCQVSAPHYLASARGQYFLLCM
jgi:hypothetical protein